MAFETSSNFAEYLETSFRDDLQRKIIAFPDGHQATSGFRYYTKKELVDLSHKAAAYLMSNGIPIRTAGEPPLRVTLLAYGTIEWVACFYAIVRMGHSIVNLSPRLPEDYVHGLLAKSKTDILVTDRLEQLSPKLHSIAMPSEAEILEQPLKPEAELFCPHTVIQPDDIFIVLHSSGSTSVPKLFPMKQREWLGRVANIRKILQPSMSAWNASATYNFGGLIVLSLAPSHKAVTYLENDRTNFTHETALDFFRESKPNYLSITPWTLTMLASTAEGISLLTKVDIVMLFGAVCTDALGDRLVAEGVNFYSLYALTETSVLGTSPQPRKTGDKNWQWISIHPPKKDYLEMRQLPGSPDLWQMHCLPGCPEVIDTVKDKDGSFCTGDLFVQHPTLKGRWKVVGRQDDQLKIYQRDRQSIVNAIAYESIIYPPNEDVVDEVVLFGQGKGKLGLLVFAEDVGEGSRRRQEIERRVWETIEKDVNQGQLPTSIERKMILIVDTERTSLPQTAKKNLIRPQVYLKFQDLIEKAYGPEGETNDVHSQTNGKH
jgi:acyl-coenzyme A synthetase/AMP-(fatty) acid ligase